ncbi:TIGR03905 family TSCPD domain-containing protein [Oscillibacter sp.]|uniref:TIGR03905 family TSCPD domain-containing protein n=1 Tax=Oscillibacter sp. TaxID=1945593 RepID=UPI00289E453D|nr:TIGR03905 family TSCPD domain-containing protein [Oscillibacter sp.]
MTFTFHPRGTCSQEMHFRLNEENVIEELEVVGGCSGNLQGIAALLRGMDAREAVGRLKGIHCGMKSTSCPDQVAIALERELDRQASNLEELEKS